MSILLGVSGRYAARRYALLAIILDRDQLSKRSVDLVVDFAEQGNKVASQLVADDPYVERIRVYFMPEDVNEPDKLRKFQPMIRVANVPYVRLRQPP